MTRYCPNCGAVVPKNSINCPQCYTDMPPEGWVTDAQEMRRTTSRQEYRENIEKRHKSNLLVAIFAIIPAFFGLLGLGHIYRDRRDSMGWMFLGVGIVLDVFFVVMVFILFLGGIIGAVLMAVPTIIVVLLYVLTAIVSIVDATTGSLLRFGLKH